MSVIDIIDNYNIKIEYKELIDVWNLLTTKEMISCTNWTAIRNGLYVLGSDTRYDGIVVLCNW